MEDGGRREEPAWDRIFAALETWRSGRTRPGAVTADPEAGYAGADPSVTALARETGRDPWAVLVSTILSLRTKDAVTLEASRALLSRAPSPEALLRLGEEEIAALAYPAGFYRTKARNLRSIAAILTEKHSGLVPDDMGALLALPGVGRKTANLVLSEAFDLDAICVDIHVHRICNRAGWVSAKTPDDTERALQILLPRRWWKRINALLVAYGQEVCRPVSPHCSRCAIRAHCRRVAVERSR